MVQLLLSGCNGRMGHAVEAICAAEPELELTAGFDLLGADIRDFPVYASPAEFQGEADVVVDFSSPSALPALLSFGLEHRMPLVLATTGYDRDNWRRYSRLPVPSLSFAPPTCPLA